MLTSRQIFLVRYVFQPSDRGAVERFLDGDVGHGRVRGRAVPVLVIRRAPNDVPGADFDSLLAFTLGPAGTRSHDQSLAERVCMPGGPGPRREGDAGTADARRLWRIAQGLNRHIAGEPFGRPLL